MNDFMLSQLTPRSLANGAQRNGNLDSAEFFECNDLLVLFLFDSTYATI